MHLKFVSCNRTSEIALRRPDALLWRRDSNEMSSGKFRDGSTKFND